MSDETNTARISITAKRASTAAKSDPDQFDAMSNT